MFYALSPQIRTWNVAFIKHTLLIVTGSVPVVVGAPNIQDFAPAPGSILHIKELSDVSSIAQTMKHLAADPDAYNRTMRLD